MIVDPEGEIYKNFGNGSVPYQLFIDSNFRVKDSEENFEKELLTNLIQTDLKNLDQKKVNGKRIH